MSGSIPAVWNVDRKNGRLRSSTADCQVENKRKDVDFQVVQIERKDGERIKETESKREKPQYERAPEYHEEPK